MLVDRIILKLNSKFSNTISTWATGSCNDLMQLSDRNLDVMSIDIQSKSSIKTRCPRTSNAI